MNKILPKIIGWDKLGVKQSSYPAQRPILDLRFDTGFLDTRITYTGGVNATKYDSDGVLSYAPHNLLLRSEAFDNATINKNNVTVSADAIANPVNGATTADKIVEDTADSSHTIHDGYSTTAGQVVTSSIYAKAAERSIIRITEGATATAGAWFNLSTGAVGTVSGSGSPSASITDVGDGWYRCEMTWTAIGSSNWQIGPVDADGNTSYQGESAKGVYVFGGQLNLGSTALTYVPTTTAAVWTARFDHNINPSDEWKAHNLMLNSGHTEGAHPGTNWTTGFASGSSAFGVSTEFSGEVTVTQSGTSERPALHQAFTFELETTYTLGVYFESGSVTSGSTTVMSVVSLTSATGTTTANLPTTPGWQSITFTTAADGSGTIRVGLGASSAATGSVVFSRVQLVKGSELLPYVPTTTAAVAAKLKGVPLGLLIEEARTNYILQSEDIATSWTLDHITADANSVVAPDGTTTADTMVEDGATGNHRMYMQARAVTPQGPITASVYAKKTANRNWIYVNPGKSTGGANGVKAYFDLTNGVVGTTGTTGDAVDVSATITNVGNGWYRCTVSSSDLSTDGTQTQLIIAVAEGDNDISFAGGSQDSLYVWGIQLEAGSFPTSYVRTTTAAVARTADVAQITDASWYNQPTGTFVIDFRLPRTTASFPRILAMSDGSVDERLSLYYTGSSGNLNVSTSTASGTNGDIYSSTPLVAGALTKIAVAYAVNDLVLVANGVSAGTEAASGLPTVTKLHIGEAWNSTTQANGHISRIMYWPHRLSDLNLQNKTI